MAQDRLQSSDDRRDLTIRQRLSLLLAVFLLAATALAAAAQATLSQRNAALHAIEARIEPAHRHLDVVVARAAAADPANPADEEAVSALEAVGAHMSDVPRAAGDLVALEDAVAGWLVGTVAQAELVAASDAMREALWAEQARQRQVMREADARLSSILWVVLALAVVLGIATWGCLQRWVNTPLARLAAAADRVTDGDLHHRIPEVGAPELSGLASDLERMRARLVGLFESCRRANEALDQQGVAVVSLRAELEPALVRLPASVRFAARLEPAEGVLAGDWYECVDLGDGRVALAVADVSGHGTDAGIFALRAKHLLRAALEDRRDPGGALGWLADHMGDTGERFLTAFVAEVDTRTGRCRWASAGHPPGAIIGGDGVDPLEPTGPILGPLPGKWRTHEAALAPGSVLVAYTDGLVEIRGGGQQFGYERLCALAREGGGLAPDELVAEWVGSAREFSDGRAEDDITVVALSLSQVASRPLVNEPA